jgi:hypothetical protein
MIFHSYVSLPEGNFYGNRSDLWIFRPKNQVACGGRGGCSTVSRGIAELSQFWSNFNGDFMGDFMGFHGDFLMIQIDLVSYKEDGASSNFQRFYGGFSL